MTRIILFLFIFFLIEVAVIIRVGSAIGAFAAITWLFLDLFIGAAIFKLSLRRLTGRQGDGPGNLLTLPVAGFLFFFPGFISDALALLFLIPGLGTLLTAGLILKLVSYLRAHGGNASFSFMQFGLGQDFEDLKRGGRVYDAKFRRVDRDDEPKNQS